jgi:Heterokaryon incompatibility protein (HET)
MDDLQITYDFTGEVDKSHSIYRDLPTTGRHIRLLTFNHKKLPNDDPISINLETYDLDSKNRPSYWALSYTWGNPLHSNSQTASPVNEKRITYNGQPFDVTENLYDFMKRYGDKKYYWIDAVCINQKNDLEKNAQVSIMIWIYSKAASTFIWLGIADEAAMRTHDLVVKFVMARNKIGPKAFKEIDDQDWKLDDKVFFDKMGLEPWLADDWKAILDFFARSWFHRQWVVQEVIVQNSPMVFYGDRGMMWESLRFFILFTSKYWGLALRQVESELHRSGTPTGIHAAVVFQYMLDKGNEGPSKLSTDALLDIVSDYRTYSERFDAFTLYNVYRMRGRKASNPADHVYAPLSLAKKFQRDVDTSYPVNYKQSIEEVYINFSAYLMRVPRPMVLAFREDDTRRRLKYLPSWVPDYSVEGEGTPLGMRKRYEACGKDILRPYDSESQ